MKLARADIKAVYGNQNIVRYLIVNQMLSINAMVYFVQQMAGYVLNIGLKRISDTVRKDSYASPAGMKWDLVDIERVPDFNVRLTDTLPWPFAETSIERFVANLPHQHCNCFVFMLKRTYFFESLSNMKSHGPGIWRF